MKNGLLLAAIGPQTIKTPVGIRACQNRLNEIVVAARNVDDFADEIQALREKIDFLQDNPEHYL